MFTMMIDDCLAGFEKRLPEPWGEKEHKHLYDLGALYGESVHEHPFSDILGGVYQAISSHFGRAGLGQYFTPDSVAKPLVQTNYRREDFEEKNIVRFCEPTVGSGALVLPFIEAVVADDPWFMEKLSITMIDLDLLCVKMALAQVMPNVLIHAKTLGSIHALHGNSLGDWAKLETFYRASTLRFDEWEKQEAKLPEEPPPQESERDPDAVVKKGS